MTDKMDGYSMDIELDAREKLRAIFPECFVEGKLDLVKLESLCGEFPTIDENDRERYEFRWKGKTDALKLAQQRSLGCLRPAKSESVEWDTTKNVYIEGDNLEVLKLLQRSYFRKVKMIYIDPPYNTGNDFVYEDDFSDNIGNYKKITSQGTTSNPETAGRYHTNWLNMMYPRLRLAKNLLRDDGVIFISIDDNEVHNLRKLCDEVFGEENFISELIWQRAFSPKNDARYISNSHDYVLMYARSLTEFTIGRLERTEEANARYSNPDNDPRGVWMSSDISVKTYNAEYDYPITLPSGRIVEPPSGRCWRQPKEAFLQNVADNRIWFGPDGDGTPRIKRFLSDLKFDGMAPTSIMLHKDVGHSQEGSQEVTKLLNAGVFDGPKPVRLLRRLLTLANTSENDIILDFFSGSATTAHAVMQLNAEDGGNRRFIMVQLPELLDEKSEAYKSGYRTICDIGKTRIFKAGIKIKSEQDGQIKLGEEEKLPLDIGYRVFKLDTSNLKVWDNTPTSDEEEAFQRMMNMLDVLKPDRSEEDVVYEVLLKLGQELTEDVVPLDINGKVGVYAIHKDVLFIVCLARGVTAEDAEKMAEYMPGRIIFADECFSNSVGKANVYHTLKNHGITIKVL
ncbi:MAG: putative methyltransferase [Firmicutes bacterium ADurb.Bin193]|nr:MAG: putative methyltransferase [Firmicutes bacterium ADurb.Bin193]